MKHKYFLPLVLAALLLNACKKSDDDQTPAITHQSETVVVSYFQLSPDTFYSPIISKYLLPSGSYVVKAIGKNNGPEMLVYFKGTEPAIGSKYVLVDSRSQPNLNEGEAFIRIKSNASTYFSYSTDTLTILAQGTKKIIQAAQINCSTEQNTDSRKVSLKIVF